MGSPRCWPASSSEAGPSSWRTRRRGPAGAIKRLSALLVFLPSCAGVAAIGPRDEDTALLPAGAASAEGLVVAPAGDGLTWGKTGATVLQQQTPPAALAEQLAPVAPFRRRHFVMEDGVSRLQVEETSAHASNATPAYDLILDASDNGTASIPVFVGHAAENTERWTQMMSWLPDFINSISGALYRVNCTMEQDAIQGVIDCHVLVARAALEYYQGAEGVYLDLEDNCMPSQRADFSLLEEAKATLLAHPEWYFIHTSRFPAPIALVDPETSYSTPLWEYGSNIYQKLIGTCELAQAMLDHTDHAARIADPDFAWVAAYDDQFASEMKHVVYPSIFQRRTEDETATTATPFFQGGLGKTLRNICFMPWVYTTIDVINAHGAWFSCLLFPVIIIACLTGDLAIAAWCFAAGFVVCWSLGFR